VFLLSWTCKNSHYKRATEVAAAGDRLAGQVDARRVTCSKVLGGQNLRSPVSGLVVWSAWRSAWRRPWPDKAGQAHVLVRITLVLAYAGPNDRPRLVVPGHHEKILAVQWIDRARWTVLSWLCMVSGGSYELVWTLLLLLRMIASAVTCSSTNSILDANLWLVCISVTDWCIRQQCSDRMHVAWLAAAQKDILGAGFSGCGLAKSKLITSENGDSFYFFFLERNSCIQVPPLYLFIWSSHSLRKSLTISLVNKIWILCHKHKSYTI
jgi:hypothetical protein